MKTTILLAFIVCNLFAEEQSVDSLKADLQAARDEIAHLKAQHAWCTTELQIWIQNPEVVQVRLNLMRETAKAEERKKAAAAKAKGKEPEPSQ